MIDHTGHMHEDAAPNMEHDHRSGSVDHMMMSMVVRKFGIVFFIYTQVF